MGIYFNPGNENFKSILNGIYVDKTGLIDIINNTIDTPDKLTCISRPRRFGKSYTAKMLSAYYDKSCDSRELFRYLEIENKTSFEKYLNKFNVIYLDITGFISSVSDIDKVVETIRKSITDELKDEHPDVHYSSLGELLIGIKEKTNNKFFFIIDEWDALFRECKEKEALQEEYIKFLRELFKNGNITDRAIAGAFMTGILPIKKYGHQSAISDFREYTMLQPSIFAEYVGFTKWDIDVLSQKYTVNKSKLKKWYDGYSFDKVAEIYNPNSVCQAVRTGVFDSYWSKTETYEALLSYINMDVNELQADLIQMIGGNEMPVDTATFQNDMTSIQGRDDVLSLLIHLGYLAFDSKTNKARIPNEEIRREFVSTVRKDSHKVTNRIILSSDQLIMDTIECNEDAVARAIQNAHDAGTFGVAPLFYNDEQALRAVVKFAYISCANNYMKLEELPSGHGYADIVYIPFQVSNLPILLIELKVNDSAEGAISQVKERNYPKIFENLDGELLMCGISYDSKTKKHECKIEKVEL
ncbi:AAA family ATPase [Butyrivibrio sp. YAB3001]|uniref:AAA family ATPase n=1 Tax=Butyrivibrio sp. YAB3001 TaxID=1520812 RepID=UPI0008F621DB|nr:AAA family ATPase [Butyrivibrio sp. YAB3001]SFC74681.1 PD-(D/E)XK nuclease superfamily protein [Butyrivibrio sp. YAB3001]